MHRLPSLFVFALLAGIAVMSRAEDPPAKREAADPGPLTAKLVAKKTEYTLDPAQAGEAFREMIKAAMGKGKIPDPPAVDLVFELTNTGAEPITITLGADNGRLDLALTGPGAISAMGRNAFTREFRLGKPTTIEAGGKHEIPIASLKYGFRGVAQHAYWTEPGEYQIAATLVTAPAGKRAEVKPITVTAPAITLKVVAPQ